MWVEPSKVRMSKAYKGLKMTLIAYQTSYPASNKICALEMDSKLNISKTRLLMSINSLFLSAFSKLLMVHKLA